MDPNRRKLLKAALLGAGGLGLRGLASGLLAAPARAAGAEACNAANLAGTAAPQRIIFITSDGGDPLNANVPGCYAGAPGGAEAIHHPPGFAAATVTLNGVSYGCGAPWATLPAEALARTCFFHHGTYTSAHGDHAKVNTLMGAIRRQEMLVSLLARNVSGCDPITTQPQPVVLSDVLVRYQGAVLPVLSRSGLRDVLSVADTPARRRRDDDLALLNQLFRSAGTPAQQAAIDRYAAAQVAARAVPAELVDALRDTADNTATRDNPAPDPATGTYSSASLGRRRLNTAAVVLFRMNVTPVVVMRWDFGGDNHDDGGLYHEQHALTDSVEALYDLWNKLGAAGLRDGVTIVLQNVFGRTLVTPSQDGRAHNAAHHCSVLIGRGFKGCVIGGVTPAGSDFRAQAIRSSDGAPDANGDITYETSLASVGKTIGAAVGVSRAVLEDQITSGKVVEAALAPA